MSNQTNIVGTNITAIEANTLSRTFLPPELYLPEWARDTEFFRCMTILLDYLQNSLKDISNPKYAMIEQAYKDIGFKYKDIMQTSEDSLKSMLVENGFGRIIEIFKLSLEQLQMLALYLPLLKIMKGTDEGYRLFLSLFANEFELETWLDNPQELEEYTFNILFISWINVGLSSDMATNFIEFSRSYVYPVLKNVEMGVTYKSLSPAVYGYPKIKFDISTTIDTEFPSASWSLATQREALSSSTWIEAIYDGEKFVALSEDGYVSTSLNGIVWSEAQRIDASTEVSEPTRIYRYAWQSITYDGEQYICIAESGNIAVSNDLETWSLLTVVAPEQFYNMNFITYISTQNSFIACSESGCSFSSIDGINWSLISESSTSGNIYCTYANNKFIKIFNDYYDNIGLEISNDAITWTGIANALPPIDDTAGYTIRDLSGYSAVSDTMSLHDYTFKVSINLSGRYSSLEAITVQFYDDYDNLLKTMSYSGNSSTTISITTVPLGSKKVTVYLANSSRFIEAIYDFFYTYGNNSPDWLTITYDGSNYIALSADGYVSTSSNAIIWSTPVFIYNLSNVFWASSAYNISNSTIMALSKEGYTSIKHSTS